MKRSDASKNSDSAEPAVGIYFGIATVLGLLAWRFLGGQESASANWAWSLAGVVFFAILGSIVSRLSDKLRVSLNYAGYAFTALTLIWFGYALWAAV
jgi:hypothetical protein